MHATLHLAVSVGRSVGRSVDPTHFFNFERFLLYRFCPTVRDWIAVYPALFVDIWPNEQNSLIHTIIYLSIHCSFLESTGSMTSTSRSAQRAQRLNIMPKKTMTSIYNQGQWQGTFTRYAFSRVLRDSTPRFFGPSVRPSHFTFYGFSRHLDSLLLPKWWSDLNYGPCPPTRDWGSRVSGLVLWYSFKS